MFSKSLALFAAVLAATTAVSANHAVTFANNCSQNIRPLIKNTANGVTYTGPFLANGATSSSSVPENWPSGIMVGLRSGDAAPDCPGCTRLECDFSTSGFKNCNLSRVSGYSIPMGFSWSSSSCTGAACKSSTCPPSDAWVPGKDDGSSLRFCQVANVGLRVTFCP